MTPNPPTHCARRACAIVCGAILSASVDACSGRVDLGVAPVASQPEAVANAIEQASHTENVVTFHAANTADLALLGAYLYLAPSAEGTPGQQRYLQHCEKSRCWPTLTNLRSLGWTEGSIRIAAGQLGWINEQGLQLCSTPNCAEPRVEPGVIVEPGHGRVEVVWTLDRLYWYVPTDQAIYACDRPDCPGGPQSIADGVTVRDLTLVGDELYWWDFDDSILRTRADGSGPKERLALEEVTVWTTTLLEAAATPLFRTVAVQVDGPWLYAVVERPRVWARDGSCISCALDYDLARWRYGEDGAEREWVILDDVTFDQGAFRGVFDGEVVWSAPDHALWSCVSDACAATRRQIGIGGTPSRVESVVADDQFLYWTSTDCIDGMQGGPKWALKRTPRIPR